MLRIHFLRGPLNGSKALEGALNLDFFLFCCQSQKLRIFSGKSVWKILCNIFSQLHKCIVKKTLQILCFVILKGFIS